jgi:hypothetical protein
VNKFLKDYEPKKKPPGSGLLIEDFLNGDRDIVVVDFVRMGRGLSGTYSALRTYIDRHSVPCNVRVEDGQIILEKYGPGEEPPAKQIKPKTPRPKKPKSVEEQPLSEEPSET